MGLLSFFKTKEKQSNNSDDLRVLVSSLKFDNLREEAEKKLILRKQESLPFIFGILEDRDWDKRDRIQAANLLGKMKDNRAVEDLIWIINGDYNQDIQEAAAGALCEIGDLSSLDKLIEIATSNLNGHKLRKKAANAVIKIGIPAIDIIVTRLKGKADSHALRYEYRILQGIGEKSIDALVKAIGDDKGAISCALVRFGEPAIRYLKEALKNKDAIIRKNAESVLDKIYYDLEIKYAIHVESSKDLELVIESLDHESYHVRMAAVKALGKLGDIKTSGSLTLASKDIIEKFKKEATQALGINRTKRAVKKLITAIKNDLVASEKEYRTSFTKEAENVLIAIADSETIEHLISAIDHNITKQRLKIVASHIFINQQTNIKPLVNLLKDDNLEIKIHAVQKLGEIGNEEALEPLNQLLDDKEDEVGYAAAIALGHIGDEEAADEIIKTLITSCFIQLPDGPFLAGLPEIMAKSGFLGDYMKIILDLISFRREEKDCYNSSHGTGGRYVYTIEKSLNALEILCSIETPISNNILHLLKQKKDITVIESFWSEDMGNYSDYHDTNKELSFNVLTGSAKRELKRRGNPSYDPTAYFNKNFLEIAEYDKEK